MAEFGYAGEILKVDLSDGNITKLSTADYADRFVGGRGIAAKIYWDMVPPQTKALDPDNCLIYVSGPTAGFTGLAGFRWQVCGKSAPGEPEAFSCANLGGGWGGRLKYAGYDGLVVQGKSDKPVYLYIDDGTVEIRDASLLWGKFAFEVSDRMQAELGRRVSVLTIGPAAENMVSFATILADQGSSGSVGLGSVMGSKKLKAIVVAGNNRPRAADPDRLKSIVNRLSQEMKETGLPSPWIVSSRSRKQTCYGCGIGCDRLSYPDETGKTFKSFCQQTEVYQRPAREYYGEEGGIEAQLLAMRLCDSYGLDTMVMQPMIEWLIECHKEGLLRDKDTGLPLSKIGSSEFIEALIRKIALREGFGDLLAQGTIKAAESVGGRAQELISKVIATRANEKKDYDPRLILTTALLYATELRRPINQLHQVSRIVFTWLNLRRGGEVGAYLSSENFRKIAKRFWSNEIAADFSTYEGKALAAKKVQDREYIKESLILCDMKWPMTIANNSEGHVGDPTLESQIFAAITGKDVGEEGLLKMGERIFNLQRAIVLRQGWGGREGDRLLDYLYEEPLPSAFGNPECLVPGKDGEVTSRKGAVVEREKFEEMKSEYYKLRGWDVESGLLTKAGLKELELGDVASGLEKQGLLK
jgi:aldehyde:ferredoxin oxidoreductase